MRAPTHVIAHHIYWNCSICQDLLPKAKTVASRRCLDLFHETCIKNALKQKRECPNCPLKELEVSQLIPCDTKRIQRIYN